jgi:nitrogen regulatory protein PII
MKAVFIVYGQPFTEQVLDILDRLNIRGFTRWTEVQGRGSNDGEPHYGNHTWPSKNGSLITFVDDQKVDQLLQRLQELNETGKMQGLKAFSWNVEEQMSD